MLSQAPLGSVVLIDCLTLWLTGLLDAHDAWTDAATQDAALSVIADRTESLAVALLRSNADVIVVTNEVGQGVVPPTASGRMFRDALGRLNAAIAAVADTADFVVAGRSVPMATFESAGVSTGTTVDEANA